jgi:probable HAF family extracellular repeat protein
VQDLGTLKGGFYSQALAINFEGNVVGYSNAGDGNWHGFLWTKSDGMKSLPMLHGASSASANGINDLGLVVGGSGNHAALWSNHCEKVESLGVLRGLGWSTAFAINDFGQVVGWSGFTAFIWSRETGMQELNRLIPSDSGWTLTIANSINLAGQITGQGAINGQQHAFLLTPAWK